MKDQPGITKKKFLYNLSRASYQKNWGKKYQPPTLPKDFSPSLRSSQSRSAKSARAPDAHSGNGTMFEASFNATLDRYRKLLSQVGTGQPNLPNDNFDTGEATGPGKYRLNDEAHAELLDALAKQNFTGASGSFGPNFWNSTGIRMLPMRPSKSQKVGGSSGRT